MPAFKSLIPNIFVANMDRSLAFYTQRLGFKQIMSAPDKPPLVWVRLSRDGVEIDLYDAEAAVEEYPSLAEKALGATAVMFITIEGVHELHTKLKSEVTMVMPLEKKLYGMTEFAIQDPDGYVITFAEPIAA